MHSVFVHRESAKACTITTDLALLIVARLLQFRSLSFV